MVGSLSDLCDGVRASLGFRHKRDIASAFRELHSVGGVAANGDDCAAIPDGDGFTLFAIEGLLDAFVRDQPWFAGYCAVMVNVSDIAAMGGRPTAVVDALWARDDGHARPMLEGMRAAAAAYGVPIVGGHTNVRSPDDRLAVAILGRARALLSSFAARTGDALLMAIDLRGAYHEPYPYWNCSTDAPGARLRGDIELLPMLAEAGLCRAAKDISMGGVLVTALMMLECSGIGATIDLGALPKPPAASLERWLATFPSFGYLLAADPENVAAISQHFAARDIACMRIGTCDDTLQLTVKRNGESETLWSSADGPFMGVHAGA